MLLGLAGDPFPELAPFCLARLPRVTPVLAAVSAALTTFDALTWGLRGESDRWYPGRGTSDLAKTVWVWLGANRLVGAAAVFLCAFAAIAVGAWERRFAA